MRMDTNSGKSRTTGPVRRTFMVLAAVFGSMAAIPLALIVTVLAVSGLYFYGTYPYHLVRAKMADGKVIENVSCGNGYEWSVIDSAVAYVGYYTAGSAHSSGVSVFKVLRLTRDGKILAEAGNRPKQREEEWMPFDPLASFSYASVSPEVAAYLEGYATRFPLYGASPVQWDGQLMLVSPGVMSVDDFKAVTACFDANYGTLDRAISASDKSAWMNKHVKGILLMDGDSENTGEYACDDGRKVVEQTDSSDGPTLSDKADQEKREASVIVGLDGIVRPTKRPHMKFAILDASETELSQKLREMKAMIFGQKCVDAAGRDLRETISSLPSRIGYLKNEEFLREEQQFRSNVLLQSADGRAAVFIKKLINDLADYKKTNGSYGGFPVAGIEKNDIVINGDSGCQEKTSLSFSVNRDRYLLSRTLCAGSGSFYRDSEKPPADSAFQSYDGKDGFMIR